MPVTGQWIPFEDAFEPQLVERLVKDSERRPHVREGTALRIDQRNSYICFEHAQIDLGCPQQCGHLVQISEPSSVGISALITRCVGSCKTN